MSIILHIARRKAWDDYSAERHYSDPSLTTEGFIHCSTVRQAIDTLNRHFPNERDLVFLCIDEQKLEPKVIYESPKGITIDDARIIEVYPHLYGPINMTAVIRVVDLVPEPDGSFQLPEEINRLSDEYR